MLRCMGMITFNQGTLYKAGEIYRGPHHTMPTQYEVMYPWLKFEESVFFLIYTINSYKLENSNIT